MPNRRRRRLGCTLLVVAMLAAVSACGADAAVRAPAAFDVFVGDAPSLPTVPIGSAPIWGSGDGLAIKYVSDVQFRGTTAIISGTPESNSSDYDIAAVDTATGAVKWQIAAYDDLPGGNGAAIIEPGAYVVGTDTNWVVLVNYYSSTCAQPADMCPADGTPEEGVAALSAQDGSVLWKVAGVPSVTEGTAEADDLQSQSAMVMAAGDDVAVLAVAPTDGMYGSQYVDPGEIHLIGLNPLDGAKLWETTGAWPTRVAGDVILARVPDHGSGSDLWGDVVALDVGTGQQKWSLASAYPHSALVTASSDTAVVRQIVKQKLVTRLIRLSDGTPIATITPPAQSCVSDGAAVIACVTSEMGENHLMTYDSGAGQGDRLRISKKPIASPTIVAVWHGYYIFRGIGQSTVDSAVDRSGNTVTASLPGRTVVLTDQYAVFDTSPSPIQDPGSFAVYAVAS